MKDLSSKYYKIEKAIGFLKNNFRDQPNLNDIAEKVNLSSYHFQRLFLDWVGLTPKKFLQYITIDYLKNSIQHSKTVVDAADMAGLSSQSRVYDLFVHIEGVTPQEFKSAGLGMEVLYGYHASPFGMCFIAVTRRGICELRFLDEEQKRTEFITFSNKWGGANLVHRPDYTQGYIHKIFKPSAPPEQLKLFVQGTPYQIKVWEALLKIPFGQVTSFQQFAIKLGTPSSVRTIATAAGLNPLTYLIPCHRIITKEGDVGEFHKGRIRKKLIIGWEMAISSELLKDSSLQQ